MRRVSYDITGSRFGRLVALVRCENSKSGDVMWECVCDCGAMTIVTYSNLRHGRIAGCGCMRGRTPRSLMDLTGKVFGRLTVSQRADPVMYADRGRMQSQQRWECRCACGTVAIVFQRSLNSGTAKSCGCLNRENFLKACTKHGRCGTLEYVLLSSARARAKKHGLAYDLSLDDIKIPEFCPLLGIKLEKGPGKLHNASPTVDKIDPAGGYTKDNVWIISHKANTCKSNLSIAQLKQFVRVLGKKISRKKSVKP